MVGYPPENRPPPQAEWPLVLDGTGATRLARNLGRETRTMAAKTFSVDSGDACRIMCVNMAARLSAIGAGCSVTVLTAACAGEPDTSPGTSPNPSTSASASPTAYADEDHRPLLADDRLVGLLNQD